MTNRQLEILKALDRKGAHKPDKAVECSDLPSLGMGSYAGSLASLHEHGHVAKLPRMGRRNWGPNSWYVTDKGRQVLERRQVAA